MRSTSDIDVIDEVPSAIRLQHQLLADLQKRYGLFLSHFQSHCLPTGWRERLQYAGEFGSLTVYLADVYDIFLGKLFSNRGKDLDDLRAIEPQLNKDQLIDRFSNTTVTLMKEPALQEHAQKNWYILFGENLPL